jgi:hypothetical protein
MVIILRIDCLHSVSSQVADDPEFFLHSDGLAKPFKNKNEAAQ